MGAVEGGTSWVVAKEELVGSAELEAALEVEASESLWEVSDFSAVSAAPQPEEVAAPDSAPSATLPTRALPTSSRQGQLA